MKGKESRDAGWAAFNIDTDGNQFDFTVALGGSTVGYRTPDSTNILLTKLTDTAICRLSIQRPGKGPATNAKRLEIICPWHGNDELDLAAECVQQLSAALRLYKPIPFSIARWQRRRAGRSSRQNPERYSLKGTELRRFRDFSLRLLDFHVSRNLFRHARYLPGDLEDEVRELLGGSREHEARVLKAEPHIMIAADLFEKALEDPSIAPELRLVLLMMALESLFSADDKSELAFRMSLRIAVLNGSSDTHRKEMFETLKDLYDLRSRLVHGSWYRGSKGFVRVSDIQLGVLRNVVRSSLLYFVALKGLPKEQLVNALDRAVFDRHEIEEVRVKANGYWGLETSEERIHAAQW
jgi:Apea-like HEPN